MAVAKKAVSAKSVKAKSVKAKAKKADAQKTPAAEKAEEIAVETAKKPRKAKLSSAFEDLLKKQSELDAMRHTLSWRITRPLRDVREVQLRRERSRG